MNRQTLNSDLWVDRYGDLMYRYTLVRVKNTDTAEEIVQATFFAALQSQDRFEGRSTEKSWLFGILKHKIMDHFRQAHRERSLDLLPEDDPDPCTFDSTGHWNQMPKSWGMTPDQAAENRQLQEALKTCMDRLSDKFRQVFVLKEIEGLDTQNICNEFNIKPTNLWVILHRTRNQLKKCLETHWFNKDSHG